MYLDFLRWNLFRFTKQTQLSRGAFGHQNAATPSGGSTSPGWCPSMPARRLPSMILAAGPCPVMLQIAPALVINPWPNSTLLRLCYGTLAFVLPYLWPCDNFHVVHQPSEGGRHLVDDAMEQKLLCTMKHESSSHHQDGAVHLSFGFI